MKKIIFLFFFLSLCFASNEVIASIKPLSLLVAEIYGGKILTLLPPNRSPHFFSPEPAVIKKISQAKLLFEIGAGLEFWNIEGIKKIDLSNSVRLIKDYGRVNPHYWLSPRRILPAIYKIGKVLSETFPQKREGIIRRQMEVKEKIIALDAEIALEASGLKKKEVLLYHPAWEYFFKDYGFKIKGILSENPAEPPSPRRLQDLEADLLVLEPSVPKRYAKLICKGKNMKYVYLDPLARGNFKTYEGFILWNFNKIKGALK